MEWHVKWNVTWSSVKWNGMYYSQDIIYYLFQLDLNSELRFDKQKVDAC